MSEHRLLASIKRCNDVKLLRRFINNAKNTISNDGADLRTANKILTAARDRLWEVRADLENPKDAIERALWVALCAYEYVRSEIKNKNVRAGRIRTLIKNTDIRTAVYVVVLKGNTDGFNLLREWDRLDASFEYVILKYPSKFPEGVVAAAKRNLNK